MDESTLNKVGMPPAQRTIQRRRDVEDESAVPKAWGNQLIVSIIAFAVVVAIGLLVGWLVL